MLHPSTRIASAGQGLSASPVVRVRPIVVVVAAGRCRQYLPENLNVGNIRLIRRHQQRSVLVVSAGSRHPKTLNHKSVLSKPHMIRGWPPWPIISSIGSNPLKQ
jgi:hypothetical protein